MDTISRLIFILQALIRKMNNGISLVNFIICTTCTKISLFIEIYFIFRSNQSPDSYVELSIFVQKRSFDIFLNYKWSSSSSLIDEIEDIIPIIEHLDPSPLISIARLHKPQVMNTMLDRDLLFWSNSSFDLMESLFQIIELLICLLC